MKPLLTIWDANAISVAQVMHFSVLGAVRVNLVSLSFSSVWVVRDCGSGSFRKAACRNALADARGCGME